MSMLFKRIKDWATSITAFRTGDVIPVDGPSGTAKMSKDDLLQVTAENAEKEYLIKCGAGVDNLPAKNVCGKTINYDLSQLNVDSGFIRHNGTVQPSTTHGHIALPSYGIKSIKVKASTDTVSGVDYVVFVDADGVAQWVVATTITTDKVVSFDAPTEGTLYINYFNRVGVYDYTNDFDVTYFDAGELGYITDKTFGITKDIPFSVNGYINTSGVLVPDGSNLWWNTGWLSTRGISRIYYNLYNNAAAVNVAFYDSNRSYMSAVSVGTALGTLALGYVDIPDNAEYFIVTNCPSRLVGSYCKIVEAISNNEEKVFDFTYECGRKKINIIGDSISEGVSCDTDYRDSWAGIIRNMVAFENGGALNYGFATYPDLTELQITDSMLIPLGRAAWSRNASGTTLYGNNEFTSTTANNTMKFSLARKFNWMRVSLLGGSSQGTFKVYRRDPQNNDTELATIDCTDYADGCNMSAYIDISSVETTDSIRITSQSSTQIKISGFELCDDKNSIVFNNYGRAGLKPSGTQNDLLTLEADCDILFYALGVNDNAVNNEAVYESIKSSLSAIANQKRVVLDFCWFAGDTDNRMKSCDIKNFAEDIGATYIRLYDYMPKNSDGSVVSDLLAADLLHPNDAGHKFIANVVAHVVGMSITSKTVLYGNFTPKF